MRTPDIGDAVRVSMYNFITGTVVDWEGTVTARVSDTTVVVTDTDDGLEYIIPVRHIHVHSLPTIAGA